MSESDEKPVLFVGLACVDIVNVCSSYPVEDSDQRTVDCYRQRGGNGANSSTVMALIGGLSEFFGTLADDLEMRFLKDDFANNGVKIENCPVLKNCTTPLSIVLLNQQNGSRTILHSRGNLPEITFEQFKSLDLSKYKWIQIEGRPNAQDMKKMLQYVDDYNLSQTPENRITTSVELEKPKRPELDTLIDSADYVFVSKEYCMSRGFHTKEDAVNGLIQRCKKGSTIVCPWGEQGAMAKTYDGQTYNSPAFPPEKLMDTLGAGDTFVATAILALSRGKSLQDALTIGCKAAGAKCGMMGNKGLKDMVFF